MPYILSDRIQDTTATTGTGSLTVSGTPPVGFRTYSAVCATGDTFPYAVAHRTANEWEVGRATYTGTNTIARTFIEASSNAGSAVNFSAGTKDIWLNWSAGLAGDIAGQNLLINGDFQLNQRTFAGGALSAGVYGLDRWKAATGGANCTLSGYTLTLASGELEQIVEPAAWGVASLASSRFTVSVETPTSDVTVTLGSASGTIPAGTGRCSVTLITGAGDTGNLPFRIRRASGSNVAFGRIKLETGSVMTAWEPRPREQELMLAQRYFFRRVKQDTSFDVVGMLQQFSTTQAWGGPFKLPTTMRVAPTVSFSSAGHFAAWAGNAERAVSAITNWVATTDYSFIRSDVTFATGGAVADAVMFYFPSSAPSTAHVSFDAEL